MPYAPISDYAVIGNMLTTAHVGLNGSIDWCCMPRFDSPSIFAALLDDVHGGRFQIQPTANYRRAQRYLPNTNVVVTEFTTAQGKVELTDFMPAFLNERGKRSSSNEIHRIVRCVEGHARIEVLFEPKLRYAEVPTQLHTTRNGVVAWCEDETVTLSSTVMLRIKNGAATTQLDLREGEEATFVLRYGTKRVPAARRLHSAEKLATTASFWKAHAEACSVKGKYKESIVRSYLALHLLVYAPTGALVAAPTTSLPEHIGGARNWDYRYTWLRDASLTLFAFAKLGHLEETHPFMSWLLNICGTCGSDTRVLYRIDSSSPPAERSLSQFEGYRQSQPVRVGNAAHLQVQLDVYGEVLEAAHAYLRAGGYTSQSTWRTLRRFVEAASHMWMNVDNGIWEVRGSQQHFTHSKLMCWVALDRGMRIARHLGYVRIANRWRKTADTIKNSILDEAWNPDINAFTQYYGSATLDASTLLMSLSGLLPATDSRMSSTIRRIEEDLMVEGYVRRYKPEQTDDGLDDSEGAFLWCSFWMARNLLRLGRYKDAQDLYERILSCANHVGLLAEMVDPANGEALGNMPQALSHLGVIVTGIEIENAHSNQHRVEERSSPRPFVRNPSQSR
ncbi:MAG: glycoside hydrolase family 15 protein [Dehalococcoidia bacterium]|nr:glycoside hydrolase family 15 protein [Dehalococcoidia bacterium]